MINNILAFGLAFLLTGILIPQILVIAFRKNLFDGHDSRKVHFGEVPRLGGIAFVPAIIFSVLATIGYSLNMDSMLIWEMLKDTLVPLLFLICALMLLFLVGIADDLIGVRYGAKFMFQIIAAILIIFSGVWVTDLYGLFGLNEISDFAGWIITALAVVYVVNAINLIDGIDGLAAGLAALALLFYGVVFYFGGSFIYSMVAFGACGSLLPFIYYNVFGNAKRGKKIFMGDTGSLTIGMAVVFLAINVTECDFADDTLINVNPMVVAIAPLIVPLFDVARVSYRRVRMRRNPFMPDRTHIHHKLLALGLTQGAALTAILVTALVALVVNVLLSMYMNINLLLLIDIVVWIVANLLMTRAIRRRERRLGKNLYI